MNPAVFNYVLVATLQVPLVHKTSMLNVYKVFNLPIMLTLPQFLVLPIR